MIKVISDDWLLLLDLMGDTHSSLEIGKDSMVSSLFEFISLVSTLSTILAAVFKKI
jgi:hypothetical protein